MIDLRLRADQKPTKAQLDEALSNSIRAKNLLDNPDFQWWRNKLEYAVEKEKNKLAYDDLDQSKFVLHRGIIRGVTKVFRELEAMAENFDSAKSQLEEYARRNQDSPVA